MQMSTIQNTSIHPVSCKAPERSEINLKILDINFGNQFRTVVDGQELHTAMQVQTRFSTWMANRINTFSFREMEDYIIYLNRNDNAKKGRPFKCYFLTLNMARALAAYEKTVRSMQVRDYITTIEMAQTVPPLERSLSADAVALKQGPEVTERETLQIGSPKKETDTGSRSGECVKISLSTGYTRRPVTKLVRELCRKAGLPLDIIYRAINRQFGLGSITMLPEYRIDDVATWLKEEISICEADPKAFKACYVKKFLSHIPIRFLRREDLLCLEAVEKAEKKFHKEITTRREKTPVKAVPSLTESSAPETAEQVHPPVSIPEAVEPDTILSEAAPMSAAMSEDAAEAEAAFDFWNPPSTHISLSSMIKILGFRTKKKFYEFFDRHIMEIIKLPCGTSRMIASTNEEDWYHRDILCFLLEKSRVAGHA